MNHSSKAVNWHLGAVLCLALAIFFSRIHRVPVPTVDGTVRASMAEELLTKNVWWPPYYQGKVFIDHPPLFVWLTAVSFNFFGTSDFAANFVPRLFAALTLLVTALIALEAGLSPGASLVSVLILVTTRDFVLSSVRGYIEPLLIFFMYAAVYFAYLQKNRFKTNPLAAILAGVFIFLAFFSKGPVALWPFLFVGFFLIRFSFRNFLFYFSTVISCFLLTLAWINARHGWDSWSFYLQHQVLSSALDGRGGAQEYEPFYFVAILLQYYWPWLPAFLWAAFQQTRTKNFFFLILALGFLGGFSLVKWKFWYYIAPAYPAMALYIASSFDLYQWKWMNNKWNPLIVICTSLLFFFILSFLPINLHRERVPEVLAFQSTILNSSVPGPVWFLDRKKDHNMVGTSGYWYFKRIVEKVQNETVWEKTLLSSPAWIIVDTEQWSSCRKKWCAHAKEIQAAAGSSLIYYGR